MPTRRLTIHGRRTALARLWRRLEFPRLFLPAVLLTYLLVIASYVFVWIVDPYGLRPWGAPARLSDLAYVDSVTPLLFPTAARDGTDLVVVGGSTARGYMPAMLRAAFPEAKHAVNLSFDAASAEDFDAELNRLETSTSLRRLILSLDWPLIKDNPSFGRIWRKPPYDGAWFNPAPDYSAEAVRMSAQVLRRGVLAAPDWLDPSQQLPDTAIGIAPLSSSPRLVAELARQVEASRPWIVGGRPLDCGAMPNLQGVLAHLRRLAARGVAVDIVFPPYSLAMYASWSMRRWLPGEVVSFRGDQVFAAMVSLRRCAVQAAAAIPNVRVHGFDTDATITANLALYRDTSHVLDPATNQRILQRIVRGDSVLTAATWPAFEARLRDEVQTYRILPAPS